MRIDLIRCWGRVLLILFAVLLVSAEALRAQIQKIRISTSSRSNTTVAYYVAVSKGFFREEGFDVELIQPNPRLGAMALMNGDVAFTGSFVSTVRGILQGLPLKVVLVALPKGVYYLLARSEVKDIQDLKGKKLGVSTLRGSDHLVAEELLRSKGFNPAWLHRSRGRRCAVAAARSHRAANGSKDSSRAAGSWNAGFWDDHLGSAAQGKPSNGEARAESFAEGQPFHRRQSPGNHSRIVAMGETITGDCRSLLRPRTQNHQKRRADDRRGDGEFH